jgi:hypothetical protein
MSSEAGTNPLPGKRRRQNHDYHFERFHQPDWYQHRMDGHQLDLAA